MRPCKATYLIFILLCFYSCSNTNRNEKRDKEAAQIVKVTTEQAPPSDSSLSAYDSLRNVKVDTTTLAGKRAHIMNQFYIENDLVSPDYDTLFDLTYDKNPDYVIGYYGRSGTGYKNRIKVYLYDKRSNTYQLSEQLSGLVNPTFLITKKRLTGFYLGNGGGGGIQLDWVNNKWVTSKKFSVMANHKNTDSTIWIIEYPLNKKTKKVIRPYRMVPPGDILENKLRE